MMEGLALLWQQSLGTKPPKGKRRSRLYAEKVKLLTGLPASIYRGDEGATLSTEELDGLFVPIRATQAAHTCVLLTRFLARGLAKGNKTLNWSAAVPAVPVNFLRERARFTPQKFVELQRLRLIEEVFIASLTENTALSTEQYVGRMLLSAIIFGGLLQLQWLDPWVKAARNNVRTDQYCLWLDLQKFWLYAHKAVEDSGGSRKRSAEKPIIMTRRWFADPMTRALLLRWSLIPDDQRLLSKELPNAFDLVRMFLVKAGLPPEHLPATTKTLLTMAETRLGLCAPPFLASYASGWLNGVSVPPQVWTRLCSGKLVGRRSDALQDDDLALPGDRRVTVVIASKPATLAVQQQLFRKMRHIFAGGKKKKKGSAELRRELYAYLDQYGLELSPLLSLLAAWVDTYFSQETKRSASTPERYLGSVGNILIVVFGVEDLLRMEAEDFIELYDRAIEMVDSEKAQGFAIGTIGRFHKYLVKNHGAPQLHQGYFFRRSGPPETTVDANLLSPIEFDRLKEALGWSDQNRPRTATAALLIAILGFRCGLRRNEAHKLRVCDIQGDYKPELVLRATKRRSLKSPNATRRLPLHVLLLHEEKNLLRAWLTQFDGKEREALLFCICDDPHELLPEACLFPPIRQALKIVTGDATLRYHHLRHSFATWLLLRLTGSLIPLWEEAVFLNHPEFHEDRVDELRAALMGNEHLGRKGAYAVASLCGHADLETTFTSYIHLCDWQLGLELSRHVALPVLSAETVMGATGLSRATVYRALIIRKGRSPDWNWTQIFSYFRKIEDQLRDPLLSLTQNTTQERVLFPSVDPSCVPRWLLAQRALTLYQVGNLLPEEIGDLLQIDIKTVSCWITISERIGEKKGSRSNYRYLQHRDLGRVGTRTRKGKLREWIGKRKRVEKAVFPVRPRGEDIKIAHLMLNSFEALSYQEKESVLNQVDYFIKKFYLQTGMLCFWEVSGARRYLDALRLIGVGRQMITLVDCKGNSIGDEVVIKRRIFWEKELDLKNVQWRTNGKNWGRVASSGTIGIQISEKRGVLRMSYGFRYAMYLIAIAYGTIPLDH